VRMTNRRNLTATSLGCCARLPNGDFDRIFTCSWLGTDRSGRAPRFEGNFSSRKSDVFRKRILLSYTSTPLALRAPAVSVFAELASRASSFNPAKRDLSYKGSDAPVRSGLYITPRATARASILVHLTVRSILFSSSDTR
jgi:hypothetical protein